MNVQTSESLWRWASIIHEFMQDTLNAVHHVRADDYRLDAFKVEHMPGTNSVLYTWTPAAGDIEPQSVIVDLVFMEFVVLGKLLTVELYQACICGRLIQWNRCEPQVTEVAIDVTLRLAAKAVEERRKAEERRKKEEAKQQ